MLLKYFYNSKIKKIKSVIGSFHATALQIEKKYSEKEDLIVELHLVSRFLKSAHKT